MLFVPPLYKSCTGRAGPREWPPSSDVNFRSPVYLGSESKNRTVGSSCVCNSYCDMQPYTRATPPYRSAYVDFGFLRDGNVSIIYNFIYHHNMVA